MLCRPRVVGLAPEDRLTLEVLPACGAGPAEGLSHLPLVAAAVLQPKMRPDAQCNYDLAWEEADGTVVVAEVKSLTQDNELFQIRHGLGQVLDYAHRLQTRGFTTRPVLVLERKPKAVDHWSGLCTSSGVTLTWAPAFAGAMQ